jgi:hypothetical protein
VDDRPRFQYLVWKDNWNAVRDEVAVLNAQTYLADIKANKREMECAPHKQYYEWLFKKGNSMDAALVDLAERLAWELGWYEDTKEIPGAAPAGWHAFSMQATRQLNELIFGAWRPYIEAKSGRGARGTEADVYIGNAEAWLDRAKKEAAIETETKAARESMDDCGKTRRKKHQDDDYEGYI